MDKKYSTEEEALKVAEAGREDWQMESFLKDMFMGKLSLPKLEPYPEKEIFKDTKFAAFYNQMKIFLGTEVDSDAIDREGKIPAAVINRLREMGAFGIKIGVSYGGLGFNQAQYNEILKLVATFDANLVALLSAHQSIGVSQPLIMFGTEAQRQKYLPRIAKGQISAFALTESTVGSDPSKMQTIVEDKGDFYLLNGKKLWCTNGTIADVIVVMARHYEDNSISAFIVEMKWEGVIVERRCHFMGLKALENGVLSFTNVKIPKENLIWAKGRGLKLALTTLNTGRLSLPAAISGGMKKCLELARLWAKARVQWGYPLYKHEAISAKIADLAADLFAMEGIADMGTSLYDRHHDIRLEAAVAKLYNSETGWRHCDELLQMRGGRGFETADSLKARGEYPMPVERILRDFRINRIFEGTTEVMHLFIAREAVDKHLKIAGVMIDKEASLLQKAKALPKIFFFYFLWYLSLWFNWSAWPRFSGYGVLAPHLRFVHSRTRKLGRQIFHGMVRHGPKLQSKQLFLFRIVDIGTELYALTVALLKAKHTMKKNGSWGHDSLAKRDPAYQLIRVFFCNSSAKIDNYFDELWNNVDSVKAGLAKEVCEGSVFRWLEEGIVPLNDQDRARIEKL